MTPSTVRIVKEHEERLTELLDTAQELFYQKGYANTSVASIIDAVGIAKGTFYHYFQSKADLLDQIIDRQIKRIDATINPIIEDSEMGAVDKFNMLWSAIGNYKTLNKEVMMLLARVLYADENVIFLRKMTRNRIRAVSPKLAQIIAQGITEGVFDSDSHEHTAELIIHIGTCLGDEFGRMVLDGEMGSADCQRFLDKCQAYDKTVAKILGVKEGTICMLDQNIIAQFFEE